MSKLFIGTLPDDITEDELRELFSKFGDIKFISLKNPPRPPPFAFLEYLEESSASNAVREMHEYELRGQILRVEICRPNNREHTLSNSYNRRYGSIHRLEVTNLSSRISWQDLKDIFRDVGDVVHTEVDGRGRGIVSFRTPRDMDYAMRQLDGEEIHGQRIRVREEYQSDGGRYRGGRSRDRSRSRHYQRRYQSRSRSRYRSRRSESRGRRHHEPSRSRSKSNRSSSPSAK